MFNIIKWMTMLITATAMANITMLLMVDDGCWMMYESGGDGDSGNANNDEYGRHHRHQNHRRHHHHQHRSPQPHRHPQCVVSSLPLNKVALIITELV